MNDKSLLLQSSDDNYFDGVEYTAHHPGFRGVVGIMSVTMPLLYKTLQLPLHQSGTC